MNHFAPEPISDKSTVPTPPSPNGTIYMFSTWDKLETDYNNDTPFLNPIPRRYFKSIDDVLKAAITSTEPYPHKMGVTGNGHCTIFTTTDAWGEPVYIYVWAIEPAGGAE